MNQPAIDWQAALTQHERWLRTVVLARLREPQAVDEVMQEVALAAVKQAVSEILSTQNPGMSGDDLMNASLQNWPN